MSGFIAGGTTAQFTLSNDGFWPDLDADHLRASLRIDASVTNARLEVAAVNAVLSVNRELSGLKATHQADGHAALVGVPGIAINGESALVHLYRRAVYCRVGAELAERYRSFDTSNAGDKNADDLTPSIDEYRRDGRWAISDLLGKGHSTVELI